MHTLDLSGMGKEGSSSLKVCKGEDVAQAVQTLQELWGRGLG